MNSLVSCAGDWADVWRERVACPIPIVQLASLLLSRPWRKVAALPPPPSFSLPRAHWLRSPSLSLSLSHSVECENGFVKGLFGVRGENGGGIKDGFISAKMNCGHT